MKKWRNNLERGQVLVILVAGVIALLGFTALSVDMGQYYSDRRYDQNAADDSALAGASRAGDVMAGKISVNNFSCTNTTVTTAMSAAVAAAQARATTNHFTIADNLDAQHGVVVTCDPTAKHLKIDVMISSDVNTSFAQLVFGSVLHNTVEAVTIIEPGTGLGEGMAIVALNEEECDSPSVDGLIFGGDSEITINDSGAHSNSCLKCDGGVQIDSESAVEWNPDDLTDSNCEEGNLTGPGDVTPTDHIIEPHTFDIDCDWGVRTEYGKIKVNNSSTVKPLSPANYQSITLLNGEIILEPGLYCVSEGITMNGGTIRVSGNNDDDDGVTIYSNDSISLTGGTAYLRAPRSNWLYSEPASYSHTYPTIPGLLLYVDNAPSNATISINGNGDSYFRGTVNYPDGLITINGNSEQVDWLVEVIGYEVSISGTADSFITYNGDNGFPGFPYISFQQ